MTTKVVAFWATLFQYARDYAEAVKEGNPENIKAAESKLKTYEQIVINADEVISGRPM